jgi:hypothetical protein
MKRSEIRDGGAANAERKAPDYATAKMPSLHPGYVRWSFKGAEHVRR